MGNGEVACHQTIHQQLLHYYKKITAYHSVTNDHYVNDLYKLAYIISLHRLKSTSAASNAVGFQFHSDAYTGKPSHLDQLSLPSLRGRLSRDLACLAEVKAGCVHLCQVKGNTVWFHTTSDIPQLWDGVGSTHFNLFSTYTLGVSACTRNYRHVSDQLAKHSVQLISMHRSPAPWRH